MTGHKLRRWWAEKGVGVTMDRHWQEGQPSGEEVAEGQERDSDPISIHLYHSITPKGPMWHRAIPQNERGNEQEGTKG